MAAGRPVTRLWVTPWTAKALRLLTGHSLTRITDTQQAPPRLPPHVADLSDESVPREGV